jgi:hypothetical protein
VWRCLRERRRARLADARWDVSLWSVISCYAVLCVLHHRKAIENLASGRRLAACKTLAGPSFNQK